MGVPITEWRNLSYNSISKQGNTVFNTFKKTAANANNISSTEYGFFICISNMEDKVIGEDISDGRESMFYKASAPLRVDCPGNTMTFSARRSLTVPCDGYSVSLHHTK